MTDDDTLDELFEAPLAEFTAVRNRLARELKQAGRAELSAEVAGLRKPTVPVWVVNQLARRHRREVDLLLDAGHRTRAAHGEADPEEARKAFERARDAEREALRGLRAAAAELLREEQGKASDAMVDRALATLRAAAVTEEGRELLARGRLTEELETTGFDLAAALVPPRPARARKRAPKRDDGAVKAARAELEQARRRLRQAEAELERARAEAASAADAVAAAERALKRARGG